MKRYTISQALAMLKDDNNALCFITKKPRQSIKEIKSIQVFNTDTGKALGCLIKSDYIKIDMNMLTYYYDAFNVDKFYLFYRLTRLDFLGE